MNTRGVIQPALAAWVLVTLLPFSRSLRILWFSRNFGSFNNKKIRMNERVFVFYSRVLEIFSRMRAINSRTHFHTGADSTTRKSYSSWRLWWDPWSFFSRILVKEHQRARKFSLTQHKNNLPSEKELLSFSCSLFLAVWVCGCILLARSRFVYLHCSSLPFFSITSHLYTRIHWTPWTYFILLCSLARSLDTRAKLMWRKFFYFLLQTYFLCR
jgi:hypothetical protein